jgi:2-polyprenyl-3-methyl-5-hydroxy-6-metoxy-1,4-benzoquinol methylase
MQAENKKHKLVRDETYGYIRLDPIPEEGELEAFYQKEYFALIAEGGRAPEIRRLKAGGEEAARERGWLESTLYTDICHLLGLYAPGKTVLDIGCGTGELVLFLGRKGFDICGIEPSGDAAKAALIKGAKVYNLNLDMFLREHGKDRRTFDAVVFLNSLEHVADPAKTIKAIKTLLKPDGVICVRVPNDFSDIQLAAQLKINVDEWWISVPDHINYFNFKSLHLVLERLGFDILHSQGDFPMEFFLLMGDNYVTDPQLGGHCHNRRVELEKSMPDELRRRLYKALADIGMGRDCLVLGRLRGS